MSFLSIKDLKKLSHIALNTYWRSVSAEMHFVFFNKGLFFNLLSAKAHSKLTEKSPRPIVISAGSRRVVDLFCNPTFCYRQLDVAEIKVQGWYRSVEIPYIYKMLFELKFFKFTRSLSLFFDGKLYKSYNHIDSGGSQYNEVKKDVLLSASLQQTWTLGISSFIFHNLFKRL